MASLFEQQQQENPASAAQVRDLSSQIQAMQGQLAALRRQPVFARSRTLYIYPLVVAALAAACLALLLFPLRERASVRYVPRIQIVHDVRMMPVVHVIHDVRVMIATPAPLASPLSAVAVCTDASFSMADARCVQSLDWLSVADLAGARVSYTGKDGGRFTATQVTIALSQRNSSGSLSLLGRVPVDVLLTSSSQASRLQGVFDALGADVAPGNSYVVEVDQGDNALGAATFTVRT